MISLIDAIAMPNDSPPTVNVRYCRPFTAASCFTAGCRESERTSAPMVVSAVCVQDLLEPDEFLRFGLLSSSLRRGEARRRAMRTRELRRRMQGHDLCGGLPPLLGRLAFGRACSAICAAFELEERHDLLQRFGLTAHFLGGRGQLLRRRGVLLRDL